MHIFKLLITLRHFIDTPVERTCRLFRICHNRQEQMRNTVINTQFHYLWINHDKLDILRRSFIQNTHDQCIDTDTLSGTGRSCDQDMRHFRNIRNDRLSCDILTDSKGKIAFEILKVIRL